MYKLVVEWEDDNGEHEESVGFPIEEQSKAKHFAREVLAAKLRELGDDVDLRVRIEKDDDIYGYYVCDLSDSPMTFRLIPAQ